jgi:hypothetical protein
LQNQDSKGIVTGSNIVPVSGSIKPDIIYFIYKKENYYTTTCPNRGKPICYNCNEPGYKLYKYPELKKPGNGYIL